jgi:hypothetical protein
MKKYKWNFWPEKDLDFYINLEKDSKAEWLLWT